MNTKLESQAREQAFKDIQAYLTPRAKGEDYRRKMDNRQWHPYSNLYSCTWGYERGYCMKITHFKNLLN